MLDDKKNGIYTPDEQSILDRNRRVRNLMVDALTDKGTAAPDSTRDFRILNEILSASDNDVHSGAATRVKQEAAANATAMKDMVAEALLALHSKSRGIPSRTTAPIIDNEYIPEIVPGETDINPGRLNPSDFLMKEDD